MATRKLILISYLEHNKVLKISSDLEKNDYEVLLQEFRKEFKVDSNLEVTFQRFDEDWGEYIDLDKSSIVSHKEKVKAVPCLTPSIPENVKEIELISSEMDNLGSDSEEICTAIDSFISEDGENTPGLMGENVSDDAFRERPLLKRRLVDSFSTPSKRPKSEEDHIPLADPYPLPRFYRADVQAALSAGKMTKETRSSFLSAVASSMLVFKQYPTRDDYICVARTITAKYPFLSSPVGTPYGAIMTSLSNRFKEFRRTPVTRNKDKQSSRPKKSPRKNKPGITQSPAAPIAVPGEDSVSFRRHIRVLQAEFRKPQRNSVNINDLMIRTFPLRRTEIEKKCEELDKIFELFPFLQEKEQLMKELERIVGVSDLQLEMKVKWAEISPKIISQAHLEVKSKSVRNALDLATEFEDNSVLAAMIVLPALLPDTRCKVDISKVICVAKGCSDITKAVEENTNLEPYVLIVNSDEGYLVVDKRIVHEIDSSNISFHLLSAFFAYNICYPKGCSNFYSFMEIITLKYSAISASPSVKYFLTKIQNNA